MAFTPHKLVSGLRRGADAVLPYVADAGTAAFLAAAGFGLTVAAAEFFSPGLVSSAIAPQAVVAALLVTGALSLAHAPQKARNGRQKAVFALAGVAASAFAFWASWYYFSPVPDVRWRLAAFIAAVVALLFAGAAAPLPEDL